VESMSRDRDMSEYRREESTVKKSAKEHTIALIGKVTLEELLSSAWSAPPLSLDNFRDFAESEDSGENVDFWIDCERLLSIHNSPSNDGPPVITHRTSVIHPPSPTQTSSSPITNDRWQNWNDLIDDYVQADSTRTVNIPGPMRKKNISSF